MLTCSIPTRSGDHCRGFALYACKDCPARFCGTHAVRSREHMMCPACGSARIANPASEARRAGVDVATFIALRSNHAYATSPAGGERER